MTRSREGDDELPPLTVPYLESVRRAGAYEKLLAALWRHVWVRDIYSGAGTCRECGAFGEERATIRHQPGCALFGQDPALLAQMDAFDAMPEVV